MELLSKVWNSVIRHWVEIGLSGFIFAVAAVTLAVIHWWRRPKLRILVDRYFCIEITSVLESFAFEQFLAAPQQQEPLTMHPPMPEAHVPAPAIRMKPVRFFRVYVDNYGKSRAEGVSTTVTSISHNGTPFTHGSSKQPWKDLRSTNQIDIDAHDGWYADIASIDRTRATELNLESTAGAAGYGARGAGEYVFNVRATARNGNGDEKRVRLVFSGWDDAQLEIIP